MTASPDKEMTVEMTTEVLRSCDSSCKLDHVMKLKQVRKSLNEKFILFVISFDVSRKFSFAVLNLTTKLCEWKSVGGN